MYKTILYIFLELSILNVSTLPTLPHFSIYKWVIALTNSAFTVVIAAGNCYRLAGNTPESLN